MKEMVLCTGLLLIVILSTFAQEKNNKGIFEFAMGASIPLAKYASGESTGGIKGFANTGQVINFSYYFPTKTKLGFILTFLGQRNPLDLTSLENKFSNTPYHSLNFYGGPSPFPNPLPPPPPVYYKNWEFDKDAWYIASLMAGGYTTLPVNDKKTFSFTLKALIGVAYASSPQYKGISHSDTATVSILQQKNHAFGLSYSISPGLLYAIKPGLNLSFNAGYFGTASMNFDKMETSGRMEINGGVGPGGSISTWKMTRDIQQAINTINLSLGIHFAL